jgi:hypothetical protein
MWLQLMGHKEMRTIRKTKKKGISGAQGKESERGLQFFVFFFNNGFVIH